MVLIRVVIGCPQAYGWLFCGGMASGACYADDSRQMVWRCTWITSYPGLMAGCRSRTIFVCSVPNATQGKALTLSRADHPYGLAVWGLIDQPTLDAD